MSDELTAASGPQDVVSRLSDGEWHRLIVQLGRYAVQKSRRFYWRTGSGGELPDGEVTQSIVSKAIVLWLDGRRRWNRAEYGDLESFLMGVIDSLLSHAAGGADNRHIRPHEPGADYVQGSPTPESALLAHERATEADAILGEITRQSHGDTVVIEIIDAIRKGAATRREIAAATRRTVDVIDNGLKRLRRTGTSVARSRAHGFQNTR
ncbi:MAG TPA: hypothetical protein VN700_00015 [Vicinamibacterales bacterium]|nr:hypothetical protein [Vicinamibacterales bacterium]